MSDDRELLTALLKQLHVRDRSATRVDPETVRASRLHRAIAHAIVRGDRLPDLSALPPSVRCAAEAACVLVDMMPGQSLAAWTRANLAIVHERDSHEELRNRLLIEISCCDADELRTLRDAQLVLDLLEVVPANQPCERVYASPARTGLA